MTVSIDLGTIKLGQPAHMDLEELLATRLLVQGNSGSGKSHLLRRLLEQSAKWVQQIVIDPEGDFVTLAEKYGHAVVDAVGTEADLSMIAARVRQHRISAVLNLEGLDADRQMRAAAAFLNGLFDIDRDYWYPALVVVDEAQLFAPAAGGEVSEEARRTSLAAMTNLMCRGRKRGLAGVIATQRLAKLAKNVAAEASNFLMGRTFLDIDMARAADLLGLERRQAETFRNLDRGHFVALGPALYRRSETVKIGAVETSARSSSPKLMPMPELNRENFDDLLFKPGTGDEPRRAIAPPTQTTEQVLHQLATLRLDEKFAGETEPQLDLDPGISAQERDEILHAILVDLLAEPEAAFQPVSVLYQDFQVRCRIDKSFKTTPDLQEFRQLLAVARAGVDEIEESLDEDQWKQAGTIADQLPEDMRGVYLLLSKAALGKKPCPTNLELATAYGTRSPSRARFLLTYMEERGFLVCANDLRGNRIVTLKDLGIQTEPGSPD
ncbi:ATP-binding protein [Cohaesibacter celericrescens]|uniref:ATP-binding protein n=1 Tax=Cohaesibacter celericrescens TaxID=2067669 RepID=A0A2N5XMF5_9HYPH|nr:ATP-binding protein [Cohaesibacter celericrescens]PLW75618.1 ATP-binding protein [Cohaesibacter celericrescens]